MHTYLGQGKLGVTMATGVRVGGKGSWHSCVNWASAKTTACDFLLEFVSCLAGVEEFDSSPSWYSLAKKRYAFR